MQISDFLNETQIDALKRIAVRKHDASRYASVDGRVINRIYELAAKTHTTISADTLKRIKHETMVIFHRNTISVETVKFGDYQFAQHIARLVKFGAKGVWVGNTITLYRDVDRTTIVEVYRTLMPEITPDNPEALSTPTRSELALRRRERDRERTFREGAKCIRKRGLGRAGYILSARDREWLRMQEKIMSVDTVVYGAAAKILKCAYDE